MSYMQNIEVWVSTEQQEAIEKLAADLDTTVGWATGMLITAGLTALQEEPITGYGQ